MHTVVNQWEPTRDVLDWKDNRNTDGFSQAKFDYGVNAIGQRVNAVESGTHLVVAGNRDWNYNARGELASEDAGGNISGYLYDGIGNRFNTSVGVTDPATAPPGDLGSYRASPAANNIPGDPGANPVNQYGEVKLPGAAPVPLAHDLDGNMTAGPLPVAPGESSTLKWDAENRLIETQVGTAGPLVRYHYDPFGRRIAKTVGTSTTPELYLYDGWNLVAKYTVDLTADSATLDTTYTWGLDLSGSLQGAGGVGGLLAIHEKAGNGSAKAGQVIYPAYDGNGNIVRLFNSGGGTVASYAYDGFGNRLNPAASDIDASGYAEEQEFGFSTKFRDAETGLIYYGYRYYDPVTGRWPSRDPIEENGGINLYGFVGNASASYVNFLGLDIIEGDIIEKDAWEKQKEHAEIALNYWISFLGMRQGKDNNEDVSDECKNRLLAMIRAMSWAESHHGASPARPEQHPAEDPLQSGDPRNDFWKTLTDDTPKNGGRITPNKNGAPPDLLT